MAQTRHATGNSKPRIFASVSTEPTHKRTTTKKTTASRPKKTTTTTKKTGAGVTKKRAPNTHHKRKSSVKDKIEGVVEKVEGTIERKPGKKAAGTKKIRGTDGKNSKTAKVVA
jgi:hypothetical protein